MCGEKSKLFPMHLSVMVDNNKCILVYTLFPVHACVECCAKKNSLPDAWVWSYHIYNNFKDPNGYGRQIHVGSNRLKGSDWTQKDHYFALKNRVFWHMVVILWVVLNWVVLMVFVSFLRSALLCHIWILSNDFSNIFRSKIMK